jgi:hypothetical protein
MGKYNHEIMTFKGEWNNLDKLVMIVLFKGNWNKMRD